MNLSKIGLAFLALGTGVIIYLITKGREFSASDKSSRNITFSTTYCSQGLSAITMLDLPAISEGFYNENQFNLNREKLNQIKVQYGNIISKVSEIVNIPDSLIYSFIFIESAGQYNVTNGNAIGLMQVGSNSATDIIYLENKKHRLGQNEKDILKKYLGSNLDHILSMKYQGQAQLITKTDLLNPELNILIGSIYLAQLIDEHIENGKLRLDKVVVRYNQGYYAFNRGRNLTGSITDTLNKVNITTKTYITKLIGKNGVLEILESEKCH